MANPCLFELCVETLEAARIGEAGGADRIELCSDLAIGGVTPSLELTRAVVSGISLPVHVLIRVRGGDFVYSEAEFFEMRREVVAAKEAGAAGVVIGMLLPDGRVDIARTRELAELAAPLRVTFHRAFDEVANRSEGLEDVILTGADCLLTSGGQATVLDGAAQLAALQLQAEGRIEILAGGGLTLGNLPKVVRQTGITHLHGSMQRSMRRDGRVLLEDVVEAVRLLREAAGAGRG